MPKRARRIRKVGRNKLAALWGNSGSTALFESALRLAANFITGSLVAQRGDVTFAFTRASSKTYFDSTGTLQTAATHEPCYDYDPATGEFIGLTIHEARTNYCKTNLMTGAAVGIPGTLPTDFGNYNPGALTREIVGISTEDGITYIDIRAYGTLEAPSQFDIHCSSGTFITASVGQKWTNSVYFRLVGGSLANVTATRLMIDERSAGTYLSGGGTTFTPTSASLKTQRQQHTRLLNQATTDRILPYVNLVLAAGAIDITLRIGMPQIEDIPATATSDKASPVIATSGTAATRAADVCSLSGADFSSWYNQSGGTFSAVARIDYVPIASTFGRIFDCRDAGFTSSINCVVFNRAGNAHSYFGGLQASTAQFAIDTSNVGYDLTPGTPFRRTLSFETNNAQACADRATLLTDTVCTQPTPDRLYIGSTDGNSNLLNGGIQSISYYNKPLNSLITSV